MYLCYHHNDMDGKGAGIEVYRYLTDKLHIQCTPSMFIMRGYDEPFSEDDYSNKVVFIVDLSFTKTSIEKLFAICEGASKVIWIDHHESSAKCLRDDKIIERIKKVLGDKVSDVKVSSRLVDSPSCVVGEQGHMLTAQMRRLLEATGQQIPEEKYILEINPTHPLIVKASEEIDESRFAKWAELIYAQALLADQGALKDPSAFVKCMNELLIG